jgi:GNAT superfamily N-acetyltransferase
MPLVTDVSRVRLLLDLDRTWSAYAIGDLAREHAPHCSWHVPGDGAQALVLLYQGFDPPILFAMGEARDLAPLFAEIGARTVSLHVQPDALTALAPRYQLHKTKPLWRMVVERASFRPSTPPEAVPVGESDLPAITALYDEGRRHDEGPAFFFPWMLSQGTFRGIWEEGDLITVAGTHQFSRELGICTIGNVYTRRDRRGRGLAARVTSAVVEHALSQEIPTIVLNVSQENTGARRLYERLGFRCYCEFVEGEARRQG